MTASSILRQITEAGLTLTPLPDGKLWVSPREKLTPALAEAIRVHKAELLAVLSLSSKSGGSDQSGLTTDQERQLTAWLATIGETDPRTIADLVSFCRRDPDVRAYHLRQARHVRALSMLTADGFEWAYVIEPDLDPEAVIVTIAIRGLAVYDMSVPRDRWDPFLFLGFVEKGKTS